MDSLSQYVWSGIEVVITGLTRNQFAFTGTWVRIPPAPPNEFRDVVYIPFFCKEKRKHPVGCFCCLFIKWKLVVEIFRAA